MDYKKQIDSVVEYIRSGEKGNVQLKLGLEFEHFVVDKDSLESISYYGKNGVGETLKQLEEKGWDATYEGEYILALDKGNKSITLEPGSQLELSLGAMSDIKDIENEYMEFLRELIPLLEEKNQGLMATGYHPVSKIDDLKILPKKRYDYMFSYFKKTGTHAHNMMKGTAALQVSMDYRDEGDYRIKYRVINALSPVIYAMFDNARYFEGDINEKHAIRELIWENTDKQRSGTVKTALDDDYGYRSYAEFVLNTPPILEINDGVAVSTGDKLVRELYDPEKSSKKELEHFMTMVFPDVRTKRFMEIRMMDAVPYPLNFAAAAMWKGIIYNDENLRMVYDYIKDLTIQDVEKAKDDVINNGIQAVYKDKSILEIAKWLVEISKRGLSQEEISYIYPLEEMLSKGKNPYMITKDGEPRGKKEALNWCLLNQLVMDN